MPTSKPENLTPICQWLIAIPKPDRVLDVGVGLGKWGVLVREYVDHWCVPSLDHRHTTIHGVEACADYIGPMHHMVYDGIFLCEALDFLRRQPADDYDLILAVDVLEHFEKGDGGSLLAQCSRVARRSLIAVPDPVHPQEAWGGNEFERHRSEWTAAELEAFGHVARHPGVILLTIEPKATP